MGKYLTVFVAMSVVTGCSPPIDGTRSRSDSAEATTMMGRAANDGEQRPAGRLADLYARRGRLPKDAGTQSAAECERFHADGVVPKIVDQRLSRASTLLCFRAFAILHSGITRTPLYVAEHLTRESVVQARLLDTRDNRFHPEPRLASTDRAELADYRASGYDRGHMAPSGDMGDPEDDFESFSLANIVPQNGSLNRRGWAELEEYVRDLADQMGQAYVVTGPAFLGAKVDRLGKRVLMPSHVWKAVYVPAQGSGAWIVTNDPEQRWETVSISTLVTRVGIDPFPQLDSASKMAVPAFPTFERSIVKGDYP